MAGILKKFGMGYHLELDYSAYHKNRIQYCLRSGQYKAIVVKTKISKISR